MPAKRPEVLIARSAELRNGRGAMRDKVAAWSVTTKPDARLRNLTCSPLNWHTSPAGFAFVRRCQISGSPSFTFLQRSKTAGSIKPPVDRSSGLMDELLAREILHDEGGENAPRMTEAALQHVPDAFGVGLQTARSKSRLAKHRGSSNSPKTLRETGP